MRMRMRMSSRGTPSHCTSQRQSAGAEDGGEDGAAASSPAAIHSPDHTLNAQRSASGTQYAALFGRGSAFGRGVSVCCRALERC
jgi:hypothetical protein